MRRECDGLLGLTRGNDPDLMIWILARPAYEDKSVGDPRRDPVLGVPVQMHVAD